MCGARAGAVASVETKAAPLMPLLIYASSRAAEAATNDSPRHSSQHMDQQMPREGVEENQLVLNLYLPAVVMVVISRQVSSSSVSHDIYFVDTLVLIRVCTPTDGQQTKARATHVVLNWSTSPASKLC